MVGEPHFIKLVRVLSASREAVFAALSEEEQLRQWCAPRGMTVSHCVAGAGEGAAWRVEMQSSKGAEYRSSGVCSEIVPLSRIVYTHSWEDENDERSPETVVTIELEELAGRTLLTFSQHGFPNAEARDGHEEGWCTALEKLAEHLGE